MGRTNWTVALAAVVALGFSAPVAASADDSVDDIDLAFQGQGQGRGNGNQGRGGDDAGRAQGNQGRGNDNAARPQGNQGRGNDNAARPQGNQGRGNDNAARAQGNAGRGNAAVDRDARGGNRASAARRGAHARPDGARLRSSVQGLPDPIRRMVNSGRRAERVSAGALAFAALRGLDADRVRVEDRDGFTIVKNADDRVLFRLDDDEELGAWRMRRLGDRRPNEQSPAFCRSGEGHPVWGREWCLDKGFGLGSRERTIWSRADDDLGVIFRRRPDTTVLDSDDLLGVLGDIIFGRLAVQSLALGYDEPLAGRWVASSDERDAPYVLRLTAGDAVVAELVDDDRDDEVDVLYVLQPRW